MPLACYLSLIEVREISMNLGSNKLPAIQDIHKPTAGMPKLLWFLTILPRVLKCGTINSFRSGMTEEEIIL